MPRAPRWQRPGALEHLGLAPALRENRSFTSNSRVQRIDEGRRAPRSVSLTVAGEVSMRLGGRLDRQAAEEAELDHAPGRSSRRDNSSSASLSASTSTAPRSAGSCPSSAVISDPRRFSVARSRRVDQDLPHRLRRQRIEVVAVGRAGAADGEVGLVHQRRGVQGVAGPGAGPDSAPGHGARRRPGQTAGPRQRDRRLARRRAIR